MGYYDDSLQKLYDEFKTVMSQEEFSNFRSYFTSSCTIESLPRNFVNLIEVTIQLLKSIRAIKYIGGDQNNEEDRLIEEDPHFDDKVNFGNQMNRRIKRYKAFSSLEYVPIQMISNSYSFLPIKKCFNADKYRNNFFLQAALSHLDTCKTVKATFDVSEVQPGIQDDIRCNNILASFSHLHLRKTDNEACWTKGMIKNCILMARKFENLRKMSFEGKDAGYLDYDWFDNQKDNISAEHELTKACKELKHIEFMETYHDFHENNENNTWKKCKVINRITINFIRSDKTFDYTLS